MKLRIKLTLAENTENRGHQTIAEPGNGKAEVMALTLALMI